MKLTNRLIGMMKMRTITFEYRNQLQARWLKYMSYVTGRDMVELALEFGENLAVKIRFKYQLINN